MGSKSERQVSWVTFMLIHKNGPWGLGNRVSKTWLSFFFFYLCVSRQQQTTTIITSSGKEASDVLISKQHLAQLSKQWVRAKGASHVHWKEGRGGYPHLNKCEKWDIVSSDTVISNNVRYRWSVLICLCILPFVFVQIILIVELLLPVNYCSYIHLHNVTCLCAIAACLTCANSLAFHIQ